MNIMSLLCTFAKCSEGRVLNESPSPVPSFQQLERPLRLFQTFGRTVGELIHRKLHRVWTRERFNDSDSKHDFMLIVLQRLVNSSAVLYLQRSPPVTDEGR